MPEPMVAKDIITDSRWQAAKEHLDETVAVYESLLLRPGSNVSFALNYVFAPLLKRYESGERSQDLYDEMAGVE